MSKVAILSCILGDFDTPVDPVKQSVPVDFHRWTDENFPPITGLTPRLQYRIPKLFGWQMLPGYDHYIWLDGAWSFGREDSAQWYLDQLGGADIAFFKHPSRGSIKEEVDHIEDHLQKGKPYITSRYKNGLHKEALQAIRDEYEFFQDDRLYASTTFIYKNTKQVQDFLKDWWLWQSRYFTCDQVVLPYLLETHNLKVRVFDEYIYTNKYLKEVSRHA
jgi:hypothetical protein